MSRITDITFSGPNPDFPERRVQQQAPAFFIFSQT